MRRLGAWLFAFFVILAGEPADVHAQTAELTGAIPMRAVTPGAGAVPPAEAGPVPSVPAEAPQPGTAVPLPPPAPPPTPLERLYSARAGQPLTLFGHALFREAPPAPPSPIGAVADDYVLGIGDRLTITLRGTRNASDTIAIDRNGQVLLPELRPIPAAGRTLADFRAELAAEVAAGLIGTEVFVALAELRQIGVLVIGEVARPGRASLTAFATVLDALYAAGGVTAQGSLRAIQLVRAGQSTDVDLYELLRAGLSNADLRLRDGDRVLVPPLGPTLAVAGGVRQPGVYELRPLQPTISPEEALVLGGGALIPGPMRLLRLHIAADGAEQAEPVAADGEARLGDGDVLLVSPVVAARTGAVVLAGHVAVAGPYALAESGTVGALIGGLDRLQPDPYLPFGAIETDDPATHGRSLVPIDLRPVIEGQRDRPLDDGDAVIVLSGEDVRFLSAAPVLALLRGELLPEAELARCAGLVALARALSGARPDGLASGPLREAAFQIEPSGVDCPAIFQRFPDLLPLAVAHGVLLWRGVPRPGLYPVAAPTSVGPLLELAGRIPPAGGSAAALRRVPAGPIPPNVASARPSAPGAPPGSATAASATGRQAAPGEVVSVAPPGIVLAGHVWLPGFRPLSAAPTLRALLAADGVIRPDAYPLIAVIARHDATALGRRLVAFSPRQVLAREANPALHDQDEVRLFTTADVMAMLATAAGAAESAQDPPGVPREGGPRGDGPARAPPRTAPVHPGAAAADPALVRLLLDHAVTVSGAVGRPGLYPVVGDTPLDRLFEAAGGLGRNADRSNIEITTIDPAPRGEVLTPGRVTVDLDAHPAATVFVRPGDTVRINPLYDPLERQSVAIAGEVRRPGEYDLVRGERLSSLIARAGGLTDQAYPAGAVFTRIAEREQERARFHMAADDLDQRIANALVRPERPSETQVNLGLGLAARLRAAEPTGRIVVEADPEVLRVHPERDIVLQRGDRVHVPVRPLTVAVVGEVQSPAALQFRPGKTARDYIREAGGYTGSADTDRVFVIHPNGAAQPLAVSSWNHTPVAIPPGSVIVVPQDPEPFDFLAFSGNIAGLLSQIALTAASVTVIGR